MLLLLFYTDDSKRGHAKPPGFFFSSFCPFAPISIVSSGAANRFWPILADSGCTFTTSTACTSGELELEQQHNVADCTDCGLWPYIALVPVGLNSNVPMQQHKAKARQHRRVRWAFLHDGSINTTIVSCCNYVDSIIFNISPSSSSIK